jgi:hypothetical protein
MSPRLSQDTERRIAALFPPSSRAEVSESLIVQCGNNQPFCDNDDEFQLERIRFSALKLSAGNIDKLQEQLLTPANHYHLDEHFWGTEKGSVPLVIYCHEDTWPGWLNPSEWSFRPSQGHL